MTAIFFGFISEKHSCILPQIDILLLSQAAQGGQALRHKFRAWKGQRRNESL